MVDMAVHQILPAAMHYVRSLSEGIATKQGIGISCRAEMELAKDLSFHTDALYDAIEQMKCLLADVPANAEKAAAYYHDVVIPGMEKMRYEADLLESLTDKSYWPYPTYSDLLYY